MPFTLASRRRARAALNRRYPDALILDVTSRGPEPWVRFSPFYPHGGIPVPFSPGVTAASVEGIWQGLKVFERADIDVSKFQITAMVGLKRSTRQLGLVLGHRAGVMGERLLSYAEARRSMYLPIYRWVLEHRLPREIELLRRLGEEQPIVLLDYETNADLDDLTRPVSHAALIIRQIERTWPEPIMP